MNGSDEVQKSEVAKREEDVLAFWGANDIFNKSVEKEAPNGEYTFYDGPPFATGTPHYGHLVASAIKDAIPRYWTMKGYRVKRQWGWDCHGLPIENIVEKEIGTKSKKDIVTFGVKKFNDLCRERIFTYIEDWEKTIPRVGRWADMKNAYRTMDTSFMESDWWAFKKLYDDGLVYEDYRVMHICPRCETTLSQSEVAEGYRDVKDLAVTAKFELVDEPGTYLLAWTTTPWTLPGNVALAVGADIEYSKVKVEETGEIYILATERLSTVFGDKAFEILGTMKGVGLTGTTYKPLFDYFSKNTALKNHENGWKVYAGDFVTTESGTGIVHMAPAFGDDDFALSKKENLPFVQHVGMDGVFTKEVTDFPGMHVKPIDDIQATDVAIIKYLAAHGTLFSKEKVEHSYPHCWRCDTPLLNYATSSWFVAVTKVKPQLLEYAKDINWSPGHIKEGRWGQWLEGARDWSISRQRFWATTIPLWRCEECKKIRVFGSIDELEEASGVRVSDLHKDVVDEVTFACDCGGQFKRIPDVLDTWFDSGSVPYSALHYPFENKEEFEKRMPVDFIAEGQDQTRTWFYYQHVLAGALFKSRAFNNVIVNGLVLAEDGKKMSKKLKNYPDPMDVVNKYGADALRLYLLSSPVVEADNLSFREAGVDELMKKVIMRLENVYSFAALYENDGSIEAHNKSNNILDRWIIARTNEVLREVTLGLEAYALDAAARPLMGFVDDLSTWYLRRSRDRFKGEGKDDAANARATLRFVLRTAAHIFAPFTPFMADSVWTRLRTDADTESVHLSSWPEVGDVDKDLIQEMALVRQVVSVALEAREGAGIKVRQPLATLSVGAALSSEFLQIIADEVNVKEVMVDEKLQNDVVLNTVITPELAEEGTVRELLRLIQDTRKKAGLEQHENAGLVIETDDELEALIERNRESIMRATKITAMMFGPVQLEPQFINDHVIELQIARA